MLNVGDFFNYIISLLFTGILVLQHEPQNGNGYFGEGMCSNHAKFSTRLMLIITIHILLEKIKSINHFVAVKQLFFQWGRKVGYPLLQQLSWLGLRILRNAQMFLLQN